MQVDGEDRMLTGSMTDADEVLRLNVQLWKAFQGCKPSAKLLKQLKFAFVQMLRMSDDRQVSADRDLVISRVCLCCLCAEGNEWD